MHKKLEQYSWFPYVAWAIFAVALLVVLNFTMELRKTAEKPTPNEGSPFSASSRINEVERVFNETPANPTEINDSTGTR